LEVHEGGMTESYPIEWKVLRQGRLDFANRSEDVLLSVTLFYNENPGPRSLVRVVEPAVVEIPLARVGPHHVQETRTHMTDHFGKGWKVRQSGPTHRAVQAHKPDQTNSSLH
jgi:hypothetical protein